MAGPGGAGLAWRAARAAGRAVAVPGPRGAGLSCRPRRLCLRDAGTGIRPDLAGRDGRAEGPLAAAGAAGPVDRRLRAVGAGCRIRRRSTRHDGRPRWRRPRADRRREDLDLQRRYRRALRGVRPHRRGGGCEGAVGLRGRGRHAGPGGRRADRGNCPAPLGAAAVRRLPGAAGEPARPAVPVGDDHVRIDGEKTWISNGGIAGHYVVFARTGEGAGAKGLSACVVEAGTPGLEVAERIEVIAPHPLARLRFDGCRVPLANRLGRPGDGFKVAMATLDVFRATVGAAALDMARLRAEAFPEDGTVAARLGDRKCVVEGKSVSVRVDLGGCRILKKKNTRTQHYKIKNNNAS